MGAILSTLESLTSSQPPLQQEPSNPPLQETAPTPQSEDEVVGETQENKVDEGGKDGGDGEGEDEEEGECGFCLYMKAGGCRDNFVEWEKCVEESEKNKEDTVGKCYDVTTALKSCMEAHTDYYGPILKAEKAAEAEAVKELEKETEKKSEDSKAEKAAGAQAEKEKENKNEESCVIL